MTKDPIKRIIERRKNYLKNKEKLIEKSRLYYHNNKIKSLETSKQYKEKNKEYLRIAKKRYRAIKKYNGYITIKDIQNIYENNIKKYGTLTCYLCLKPIEFIQDSLEHKIPIRLGGDNSIENLDIAHRSCNCSKSDKTIEEFSIMKGLI